MAELRHKPCAMMFCSGILLSKASVAPDRLKVWNPCPEGEIFKIDSTDLSASLIWVSMI